MVVVVILVACLHGYIDPLSGNLVVRRMVLFVVGEQFVVNVGVTNTAAREDCLANCEGLQRRMILDGCSGRSSRTDPLH